MIIYIIGAFVLGVIFHAGASALWKKWYTAAKTEVKSVIKPPVP